MRTYTPTSLINYAKNHSDFYKTVYGKINGSVDLEAVPVLDHNSFWSANAIGDSNTVLTSPIPCGIVFKSGGTVGSPKFSAFSQEEYKTMMELSGLALMRNGIEAGDRIGNLFYGGQLYASFLCVHDLIEACPVELIEYPIMGSTPVAEMVTLIKWFGINVVIGVPTTIMKIVEFVKEQNIDFSQVKKIYFGGETLHEDQRKIIQEVCPDVIIRSMFYASVDGGIIGYCDEQCGFNEHRTFDLANVLEIIDEKTGKTIEDQEVEGNLVSTCLYRRLMPFIRYPVGDRGKWLEPQGTPDRKFMLLGRTDEGARVGPVSIGYDDVGNALKSSPVKVLNHQLVVTHYNSMDRLTVRVAVENPNEDFVNARQCLENLFNERPAMKQEAIVGHIHDTEIEFCTLNALEYNDRTGKLKRVIDKRFDKSKEGPYAMQWR